MDKIKLRAIVMKEIPMGEADKLIILFAKGTGKVTVKAKGARNAKNRTSCGTSLFSYCDFIVKETKSGYVMIQADIIESFYDITTDLNKLAYASVALEIAEKVCRENQPDNNIMFLLLKTIQKISKNTVNPRIALMVYYIKFMQYFGCMPDYVCLCGGKAEFADGYGFYCKNCRTAASFAISSTAVDIISYIINTDVKDIFSFETNINTINQIEKIERNIFDCNIDVNIKSLRFADNIKDMFR